MAALRAGLLVGRFQPFHYGHLAAVKYALKRVDFLYVLVGSAEKSHEPNNPFTAAERIRMVKAALDEAGIGPSRWLPIPVPDTVSHALWLSQVEALVPPFHIVFSNDQLTITLFREKGFKVLEVPLQQRSVYSATEVRRRMSSGGLWRRLVPRSVAKIIDEINGVKRLSQLSSRE